METIELSRRRPRPSNGSEGSENNQQLPDATQLTPTATRQDRVATGFADIYGSLTTRQISVISSSSSHPCRHKTSANNKTAIGSAIGTGLMVTSGLAMSM